MLCEECGKNNAEVLLTTVVNGQSATRRLCRACAEKYKSGDVQAVLAAILKQLADRREEDAPDIACPRCNMTFKEFKAGGRLGCPACYAAFKEQLKPILLRVHGRSLHAGRRPPQSEEEKLLNERMADLRARMEEAVRTEDFESAAKYRDELRAMTPAGEGENGNG